MTLIDGKTLYDGLSSGTPNNICKPKSRLRNW